MTNKVILTARDLIKGATTDKKTTILYDAMPWQMVSLEDKTQDWIEWNADFFEYIGKIEVDNKKKRILKNRMLASGILDMADYIIGDSDNNYLNHFLTKEDTPLKKNYPLIPPFINVLHGEFIKRDNDVFISCIDRETEDEKLEYKLKQLKDILLKNALAKKEESLKTLGIINTPDEIINKLPEDKKTSVQQMNQQYQEEMEKEKQILDVEMKYKKYRHVMERFGQNVFNKDSQRFNLEELETEAFIETICNSETAWHLDLLDNDYKLELIDNANSFSHQSPNIKYYSDGDYFGWFEEMTVGDIINKYGTRLTEPQLKELQESVHNFTDSLYSGGYGIIPDQFKNQPGIYYDSTKKYDGRVDLNKHQYHQNNVINDILTNTTLSTDDTLNLYNKYKNQNTNNSAKLFRVMRCYFRSQRKIGWLTEKDKSGRIVFQDWIDENFKLTDKPIYDNSLVKDKTNETLVFGQHVDWSWTNEWRHVIKINTNLSNPYWQDRNITSFTPIYIDGNRIKYDFSGKSDNPYVSYPPFDGVQFKMKGVRPVSPVELLHPYAILTNIAFNKIPEIMFDDIGLALAINENTSPTSLPGIEAGGDPLEIAMENLRVNKVLPYKIDREILKQQGNSAPIIPQVLNLSRIQEGIQYLTLASHLKEAAGEVIGISRQRLAQSKPSETATQTQAGINYSEVQTEYLFNRFSNEFMPRIYQKMIEAAVYYSTISKEARSFYQTDKEGNAFIDVENLDKTFRQYLVVSKTNIRAKELKAKLEALFMNNNTTDASMYDLALGVIESNPTNILENLRQSKVERENQRDKEYQQQQQLQQQAEEQAKQRQQDLFEHQEKLKMLENEGNENVATIRALGGLQSDNNKNGEIDALENLKSTILQKQKDMQYSLNNDMLNLKKQQHTDIMDYKNRQLSSKEIIEQKKLAASLANQTSKDDKELNKQIAKKQNII